MGVGELHVTRLPEVRHRAGGDERLGGTMTKSLGWQLLEMERERLITMDEVRQRAGELDAVFVEQNPFAMPGDFVQLIECEIAKHRLDLLGLDLPKEAGQ